VELRGLNHLAQGKLVGRVECVPSAQVPVVLRRLVFCDVLGVAEEQARRVLLAAVASLGAQARNQCSQAGVGERWAG